MAESMRYSLDNQLDIEQILLEAQKRWLRPAEICEILQNYQKFRIAPEPPNKPPSGSLFLFNRKVLRYFRKDGHKWRKRTDGKTVKEAHERLKAGRVEVLHCYYAHGEENENFQRRSYWLLEENYMHIVLVHYLEVKGSKTSFGRSRDTEDTTSLNSARTSEYEDAESDIHQASSTYHSFLESQQPKDRPVMSQMDTGYLNSYISVSNPGHQYDVHGKQSAFPGLDFVSFAEEHKVRNSSDDGYGLTVEPCKQLDLISWEEVLENTPGFQVEPFRPAVYSTQPATEGAIPKQENMLPGQLFTDVFNIKQVVGRPENQEKWQIATEDVSSHISKWPMERKLNTDLGYGLSNVFNEQKAHYMELHNPSEPFITHPEQQNGHPEEDDLQIQLSNAELGCLQKSNLSNNLIIDGNVNSPSTWKQKLLDSSRTEEGLKKIDSFARWMSKELGEVDDSHLRSSADVYGNNVDSEGVVDDTSISPQVHFDTHLLSSTLSQEQLFSIIDFSPNWAYTGSETKILITGAFLKTQEDVSKCKWSCMFGEVEVPAEVLADGVFRCHAPLHIAGRVPFYLTCSNRLACSEVREFEFRVKHTRDFNMNDLHTGSTSDMLLHIRLVKLLSLGSVSCSSLNNSVGEEPHISSKISLLLKENDGEWLQMVKSTSEEGFSPSKVKEQLLQKILKEKLHVWLLYKVTEDGKGPSVLDEEGQGVLHLAAALGYDWAIAPTIAAGVNVNFRDVKGWTALHWAAFCGRERTVGALVSLGAAPGALTDPTPKFPSGRTPADLASGNGHKGIAGYLAESSLTNHLSSLTLRDTTDSDLPEISGVKAVQTVSERNATPITDWDVLDVSLKDSLTAVCNATQAAARIHQVFRVQSFHKKQLVEYGDEKFGMSDERALSLISLKTHKAGLHDDPVHTAAIRIQNKFRGWKGRNEFLIVRQKIVKIQAHVRGHQVRKHYGTFFWSVGIVEKVILRWRRKGSGLRGFRPEALIKYPTAQSGTSNEDDYDFLKEGRKQTEERLQKALARVKSMVQYPEARDQYRRLLTVVTEFQETKVMHDMVINSSEEAGDGFDDLIDLEALLGDDTFMFTEC